MKERPEVPNVKEIDMIEVIRAGLCHQAQEHETISCTGISCSNCLLSGRYLDNQREFEDFVIKILRGKKDG